jgi:hypothetical protein
VPHTPRFPALALSDAGSPSVGTVSTCWHPKTCTTADIRMTVTGGTIQTRKKPLAAASPIKYMS